MKRRDLKNKAWLAKAGILSGNLLANYFAGRSKSLSISTLRKLAAVTGDDVEVLIGLKPDPLDESNKTTNADRALLGSTFDQLTEEEVHNLQLILQELRSIRRGQDRLSEAIFLLCNALKPGLDTAIYRPEESEEDSTVGGTANKSAPNS